VSSRRLSIGLGGSFWSLSLTGVATAALLLLGACSTAKPPVEPSSTVVSQPPSSTSTVPPTTVADPSSTTSTTTTTPPSSAQQVIDAWGSYWDAWAKVRASDDLDPAPLRTVASDVVVDGAVALFERQRSSGVGPVDTDVVLHPSVTEETEDRALIEDCVLLSPSFTDTVGVWYRAELARTGQGWVVASVRVPSASGCVPREMADEAIAAYEAFYDGWAVFWDPPDPDSPLIDQVLAEPQKSLIVGLLTDHKQRGVALRGRPVLHPEVIEVRSPTELVILSCSEADPAYGLYDLDSGKRLPDEPPVRKGQRDLESAVMVFEDGHWKVSDLQGQVDFACEFAPTDRGLPSV